MTLLSGNHAGGVGRAKTEHQPWSHWVILHANEARGWLHCRGEQMEVQPVRWGSSRVTV
jgi:hypothetical protein